MSDEASVDEEALPDELDSDKKVKSQEDKSPGPDENEYGYLTW